MKDMMMQIIFQTLSGLWQNAPVWVWPLFFVLLAIGLFCTRDRNSSIIPFVFLPFLIFIAGPAVAGLAHSPANWLAFGPLYALGALIGVQIQDRWILAKTGWRVRLRGEVLTLTTLMLIYLSNFANGVLGAVAPEIRTSLGFTLIFAGILGASAGSLLGRAICILRLPDREG